MRIQKISEADRFHKDLWSPLDSKDLVFEVIEEAFVSDFVKIKTERIKTNFNNV